MLSQENINKLNFNGLYKCEPMVDKLPSYKRNTPYWCINWTFQPCVHKNAKGEVTYYMRDTYWGSSNQSSTIELDDKNFDKFELIFDYRDVAPFSDGVRFDDYSEDDKWLVAVDSGGIQHPKRFIRKDAVPDKEKIIERIKDDIEGLEYRLNNKKRDLEGVLAGTVDLRWV